jgi:hypothetical protein
MDRETLRESLTDAIRYWEPRRLLYNAVLAAVVLAYFWFYYPASRTALTVDTELIIFELAVMANVAYCAAYPVDVFAQMSGYRDLWRKYRWLLLIVGLSFAGILTRFLALGMFQSGSR